MNVILSMTDRLAGLLTSMRVSVTARTWSKKSVIANIFCEANSPIDIQLM